MNNLVRLIGILLLGWGAASGQSRLPACPATGPFHNCVATFKLQNDMYVGEVKDGKLSGKVAITFASGDKSVGEWRNGKMDGQGTITFANGDKYVGEYKDDKYNGQGTYISASGGKYVGEWKDDKRNGQGTSYRSDGSVVNAGIWADDNFVPSAPVQQQPSNTLNTELARLRAEAEEAKRRQAQAEEQLRLAQQAAVPPAPQAAQSRGINAHALVIGNAAYAGGNRLLNPLNDARAVSQLLRRLGFTVTQVEDANRAKLVSSLAQFSRSAINADLSLLFYSGHGIQIDATNYLVPIDDVDTDFAPLQGVSINTVLERYMPGKAKLVFLDACRTNPMMASATKGFSKGLAPINVSEGTLISYAAKDGQTAADGVAGGYSPFTAALLEHLADPEDIAVVLRKVREKVMRNTGGRQQPWEYGSLTGGALVLSAVKLK